MVRCRLGFYEQAITFVLELASLPFPSLAFCCVCVVFLFGFVLYLLLCICLCYCVVVLPFVLCFVLLFVALFSCVLCVFLCDTLCRVCLSCCFALFVVLLLADQRHSFREHIPSACPKARIPHTSEMSKNNLGLGALA